MARFVCPDKEIRIAGGREMHLRSLQGLALHVANSLFLGDYLTSEGQAAEADLELIRDNGFVVLGAEARRRPSARRLARPVQASARRRHRRAGQCLRARASSLASRDRGLVWHPYAPLDGPTPYAVRSASGVTLELCAPDGELFTATDAMASWWCAIHGYRNPRLDAAAHEQIDRFSHVMFGGLTHEPAVALAERLTAIAPGPMAHVFFADSGSVSVEVALKLALQFQAAVGSAGPAAVPDGPRGLPRRHLRRDERVRPRRRHALGLPRRAGPPGLRPAPARGSPRRRRDRRGALGDRRVRALERGRTRCARWPPDTRTSWPPSSSSRCCRAPAACTSTTPTACACSARSPTSTGCSWSSTRSRPASAAPAGSSPRSGRASRPTSCASARR